MIELLAFWGKIAAGIIMAAVWQMSGYTMALYLAGLRGISVEMREAAVVGRPDPRRGEQPVAFIAMNDGVPLEEAVLLQFLRERLADYKLPRHIVALPGLPRNATGKILKTALRRLPV